MEAGLRIFQDKAGEILQENALRCRDILNDALHRLAEEGDPMLALDGSPKVESQVEG
jgi:hypothetical protein